MATMKYLMTVFLFHVLALTSYAASSTKSTANYDNISSTVLALTDPSPGTYQSLTYNSFLVGNASNLLIGVTPHTPTNVLFTSSQTQATNGTPSLTVAKPYTSFGLTDFWFGCVANLEQADADPADQCTVTVAGFQPSSDKEVALASFTFTPPDLGLAQIPMNHAVLPPTFLNSGITRVTVIQDNPLTEALVWDSASYYLYK